LAPGPKSLLAGIRVAEVGQAIGERHSRAGSSEVEQPVALNQHFVKHEFRKNLMSIVLCFSDPRSPRDSCGAGYR
jgi:hypothetical protein